MTKSLGSSAVLLAGTPRCGSTWLANVLGRAENTRSVYEPDGPVSDVLGAMVGTRLGSYPALSVDEPSGWYRLVWDLAFAGGWPWDRVESARAAGRQLVKVPPVVRDGAIAGLAAVTARVRRRPEHVLVKSVNSAFSLDWIASRYQPKIVVLHRNPLNVVSSWLVLEMATKWPVAEHISVQKHFMEPFGIKPLPAGSSEVSQTAWNVGLLSMALKKASDRHPEWVAVSYDELSADPLPGCQSLFAQLGLVWTQEAEDYLRKADDPNYVVHGGTARAHPNAVTATDGTARRLQQASQYKRRLSDEQVTEVRTVLDQFDLGSWGAEAG